MVLEVSERFHTHSTDNVELCYSKSEGVWMRGVYSRSFPKSVICWHSQTLNQTLHLTKVSTIPRNLEQSTVQSILPTHPDNVAHSLLNTLHFRPIFLMLAISMPPKSWTAALTQPLWHIIARWMLDLVDNEQFLSIWTWVTPLWYYFMNSLYYCRWILSLNLLMLLCILLILLATF